MALSLLFAVTFTVYSYLISFTTLKTETLSCILILLHYVCA